MKTMPCRLKLSDPCDVLRFKNFDMRWNTTKQVPAKGEGLKMTLDGESGEPTKDTF